MKNKNLLSIFLILMIFCNCKNKSKGLTNNLKKNISLSDTINSEIESNNDMIALVYYGLMELNTIHPKILHLYKNKSFLRIENGNIVDSIPENIQMKKMKKYIFSLKNQELKNIYWDRISEGLVRRILFKEKDSLKEIRVIGYPEKMPNDSIVIVLDEYLQVIDSNIKNKLEKNRFN
ncbi:hypothetical protein [Aureivirga sp. CE67]|uniref:hypothetical protein n=1 Tax=Aureivirga sp. CE67 TaxID=1788983 RepID=UPI0018CBC3FB|nr:hypothetical protein [Aureivirga sp. CE67]